jgi:outer membrane protein
VLKRILGFSLGLWAGALSAQPNLPQWELGVGVIGYDYPDYLGSKHQRQLALPFPLVVYRSEKFEIRRGEAKALLFDYGPWELDLSFSGSVPVNSKKNTKRQGMPDLDAAVEIGPVVKYRFWQRDLNELKFEWPLRAVLASDFKRVHHEGWVSEPGVYYYRRQAFSNTHRTKLTLGLGARWGSRDYHGYIYDVDSAYATPQRAAYRAEAGYGGAFFRLGYDWYYDRLQLGAFYRYYHLDGAAFRASPLVETAQAHSLGVMLSWRFWQSAQTIKALD